MPPDDPSDNSPDIAALATDIAALSNGFRTASTAGRASLGSIAESARATRAELTRTAEAGKTLSTALSSGLDKAFGAALKDGAKLSDVLRTLALDVSRSAASSAIGGLTGQISGALGGTLGAAIGQGIGSILPFAKGAAFDAGKVRAFAKGGIVDGPTLFPMQGATGLMGEAGPEAILPLQRTADGRLGVASGGAGQGAPSVSVTIVTRDADSFASSRTQIAATLARAVDRGRRNL